MGESKGLTRRDVLRKGFKTTVAAGAGAAIYAKGVFDGKDARPEPAQEEIDAMYVKVYEYLTAKTREALAAKKPLVVLLGDTHADLGRNPLVLQLITMDVAADLGIKTLAPQLDLERMAKLQRGKDRELVDVPNYEPAMRHAVQKRGFRVKPIDTYIETTFKPGEKRPEANTVINERNAEMVKHLLAMKEGAVAIVEDAHMRGMIESDLSEKCTVAALTTLTLDKHARMIATSPLMNAMGKGEERRALEYAIESPKVMRFEMQSKMPDSRIGRAADMVERARELYFREKGQQPQR